MKMPNLAIREEILKSGIIPFARFMELALYCPETGYYERNQDNVGRTGDFITSVSTGSLFGELLAWQFAEWLAALPTEGPPPQLIEAGAHDGKLAADILAWLQTQRPQLFSRLELALIEPSPTRQRWQQTTLQPFAPKVRWYSSLTDLGQQHPHLTGIFYSNELLDAFPVHRFGWHAQRQEWLEWGVTLTGDNFTWATLPAPADFPRQPALEAVLPDGYTIEQSPAAVAWWQTAAKTLRHGKLLAIDYGFTAEEQFSPARTKGTVRAYHQHHISDDLLALPGEQDLTAHVNFSALQQAGEAAGLTTEGFYSQPQFLTRIVQQQFQAPATTHPWGPKQIRQFQTLTHPEHLGRAFRILVQQR